MWDPRTVMWGCGGGELGSKLDSVYNVTLSDTHLHLTTLHLTPYTRHCEHPEFVDTKILVLSARIFLRCCQNRLITCYNSIEFVEILKKIYSYSRIFFSLFLYEPVKNVSNKINLASKEKILCLKRWCRSIKLSIFPTFFYILFF